MNQMLRRAHQKEKQHFMNQSRLIDLLQFYRNEGLGLNELVDDVWTAFQSAQLDLYAYSGSQRPGSKGAMSKKELQILERLHDRARAVQPRGLLPSWRYVRLKD